MLHIAAVFKEESVTSKVDASCKTSNGKSLNGVLCTGPPLQNDLAGVVLNWRLHRFVFAADIQKMFTCIDMNAEDSQYQRIFWHGEHNQVAEYYLNTVTFGTTSAPYTAIRVIHQLAQDERDRYPLAERVLRHEIYVNDVQSGSCTREGALEIQNQLIGALRSARMELRKWSANDASLLKDIPLDHLSRKTLLEFEYQTLGHIKTILGSSRPTVRPLRFHHALCHDRDTQGHMDGPHQTQRWQPSTTGLG
ncbi:uncharacterized protein [Drosophila pseudoobscura]|uniref:Uncharacterized protein isoform X1 n=2 Tax=Drosophila pseudoobscura pseudoobscura TaxID=46245 RepID=A0A6I8VNA1_DROPS|nr:uncharacterized protein LOC6899689 isoform X1 [Drosophila pseudoobscura]